MISKCKVSNLRPYDPLNDWIFEAVIQRGHECASLELKATVIFRRTYESLKLWAFGYVRCQATLGYIDLIVYFLEVSPLSNIEFEIFIKIIELGKRFSGAAGAGTLARVLVEVEGFYLFEQTLLLICILKLVRRGIFEQF